MLENLLNLNIEELFLNPYFVIANIDTIGKIYLWISFQFMESWALYYLHGPLIFLIISSLSYILLGLIIDFGLQLRGQIYYLNNIYSSVTILIILSTILIVPNYYVPVFTVGMISDELTIDLQALILYASLFSIVISKKYILNSGITSSFEYYALLQLAIIGSLILIHANNFLVAFMSIELQSFCFYILVSIYRKSKFSTESGLKYYILGSIASGIFLFGVAIIYCYLGTIYFFDFECLFSNLHLEDEHTDNFQIYIGFIFVIVGVLFKLTIAPFHMWAIDTYEGAPTSITLFMTVVPKIAGFGFLIRLYIESMAELQDFWQIIFQTCSILTMLVGTFGALYQQRIKRFLIYSSVAQVGYMLAAVSTGTVLGFDSFLFFIKVYVVTLVGIFGIILVYQKHKFIDKKNAILNLKYLSDLKSLRNENKLIAIIFTIFLFSLAGIPPLLGFFSKFYVIFVLFNHKFYLVSWVFVITSIISSFYYVRLIKHIYFTASPYQFYNPILRSSAQILVLLFMISLMFGIIPLYDMTLNARLY